MLTCLISDSLCLIYQQHTQIYSSSAVAILKNKISTFITYREIIYKENLIFNLINIAEHIGPSLTSTCMRLSVMLTLHSISLWSMDTEISLEGDKNFTPVTFVYNQNHIPYIHVRCTFNLFWCLPQLLLSFHCVTFFSLTRTSIFTKVKTFCNVLHTCNVHFKIFCIFLCI